MFLSDMSGREPLYRKYVRIVVISLHFSTSCNPSIFFSPLFLFLLFRAFVFFSTPTPKELINHLKCDTSVLPRIGALREVGFLFIFFFPL